MPATIDQSLLSSAVNLLHARIAQRKRDEPTPQQVRERLLKEFSPKLHFLFEPHPYKITYSGRYATKSWSYAAAALSLGYERPLRIVCLRETMKSIEDSVHTLMGDQIKRLNLAHHYRVMDQEIRGKNGTEIFYAGLRSSTADTIKSMEGCDIFWVEEAQAVSKSSWLILDPTIRKPGAELWASLNPRFEEDDTYQRWIVHPPKGAVVVKLSFRDNPYITPGMQEKMDHLREQDPDEYEHVYEGGTKSTVQDAVYKVEIQRAERDKRFTRVPYTPLLNVNTYWDLGFADKVSIWFVQPGPFEFRVIDFYQNDHKDINHYLQVLQNKDYVYGEHVLPWDGDVAHLGTGRTMVELIKRKGSSVRAVKKIPVLDGINMVRMIFPQLYFDREHCQEGIKALRRYQWGAPNRDGVTKREPIHDEYSHAADGMRTMAVAIKAPAAGKAASSSGTSREASGSMGWAR